jgi:hypothetical protein
MAVLTAVCGVNGVTEVLLAKDTVMTIGVAVDGLVVP